MEMRQRVGVGLLVVGAALQMAAPAEGAAHKPAILFSCPGENRYEYVGFDYMRSLVKAGFEVDYIEGAKPMTWERVKRFNVLVVLHFPASKEGEETLFARRPPWLAQYFGVVKRFAEAGGGVFFHYNPHYGGLAPNKLLEPWGLQFPLAYITDIGVERLTRLHHGNRCAFTNQVLSSPVSEGVHQIWYPIDEHYTGAHTMPILVDKHWQVVVRGSKTSFTRVPTYDRGHIQPVPGALIPRESQREPVLYAVRDLPGGGRLAATQQWHQFTIGSGMKWFYNSEILEKGLTGRASHYGRLLQNTCRWLAQPSLASGKLGGHKTDMMRLTGKQLRPGAMKAFADWFYKEEEVLEYRRPPRRGKIYRGLIGAETALSGGTGTVAEFAQAAKELGLDFVVFLEDTARMDAGKLDVLKADVAKHSSDTLRLLAGYKMVSNIGNHLFVFGEDPRWPEQRLWVGKNKRIFNLQYQDEQGRWAKGNVALNWCLEQSRLKNTVGYYKFTQSGNGMKMFDLRVYSMAAIRTYEHGKLVEDMTADYLTTCQSTAVPSPVSLNIVRSPDQMRRAVQANESLTYGQARTLQSVFKDALRWTGSYEGPNVFPSDGPIIRAWPKCVRAMSFGSERFVTGRSLNVSPIHVSSLVGLKEIRIYNGRDLFRRFLCRGVKDFKTTLLLSGVVQRSMVLVAEDIKGGVATSFAHRSYKEGAFVPIFCSDHVNDCAAMLLSHGPHWPYLFRTAAVPNAGATWDGGPRALVQLLSGQFTYPRLETSLGRIERTPYQVPLLEFGDEAAVRCRMVSKRVLTEGVPSINPWYTFGPLEPSKRVDMWASHAFWQPYMTGVRPNGWGGIGVERGTFAGLFTEQFTFKKAMDVQAIRLFHGGWGKKALGRSLLMAVGRGPQIDNVMDVSVLPEKRRRMRLDTGGWFAMYSSELCNTQLFINRGDPVFLDLNEVRAFWVEVWADMQTRPVKPGDTYRAEFFTMTWPLDQVLTDARQIADVVAYLTDPTGLELKRGKRGECPGGILELVPDDHAVELAVPRPKGFQVNLPMRVSGFNRRWTVGHYQIAGHRTHYYSAKPSGWRELGLDFAGRAYVPLYVSMAPRTHCTVGHPVVADPRGKDLFIEVTRINDGSKDKPSAWHVSVNNPTDKPVTTTLRRVMSLPGLAFEKAALTIQPGEYRVVHGPEM